MICHKYVDVVVDRFEAAKSTLLLPAGKVGAEVVGSVVNGKEWYDGNGGSLYVIVNKCLPSKLATGN